MPKTVNAWVLPCQIPIIKKSLGKISKIDKKILIESAEVEEEYKSEVSENGEN